MDSIDIHAAERAEADRIGALAGEIRVPDDCDSMGAGEIVALFG